MHLPKRAKKTKPDPREHHKMMAQMLRNGAM
jgi:hypothetical protein